MLIQSCRHALMLWVSQEHNMRSTATFASWMPPTALLLKSKSFDVAPLLHAATALENNEQDDEEDVFSSNNEPDVTLERPPVLSRCRRTPHRVIPENKQVKYSAKKHRTLHELTVIGTVGFQLIHWDSITARSNVEAHGRIIAVLMGHPNDPSYVTAVSAAYATMASEQEPMCAFPHEQRRARRDLQWLLGNHNVIRMPIYASATFNLWTLKVSRYYGEHNEQLRTCFPDLKPNFPKSYTAGGLTRYVDNRFRTERELEAEDPAEYARLEDLLWMDLLSIVEELLEDVES
ncbi:hypothetical protein C8F04DRAFT_1292527 [Mycena alexandri]|uniref:Uncharacterized protein n=1 Tax=Mycena alexandri TaxID=1745969 RepID=A0AAD6SI07_9AGAR|nr:hypothetical protein C8F04DRAFT_1292527 [Mycena alexandri]